MKCINKLLSCSACLILSFSLICGCGEPVKVDKAYHVTEIPDESARLYGLTAAGGSGEQAEYDFFAKELCVAGNENILSENVTDSLSQAAGLFDLKAKNMKFGKNVHERLYPASTTKILTAYVAIKHGDLKASATVTEAELQLEAGSSVCGLAVGDTTTLEHLLYGLLLCSGNDAANVIADLVSGSSEEFAKLMNEEAKAMGATSSNFVNPHGLQNEAHYTTVYDMYLIFNTAIQNEEFEKIISTRSHTAELTNSAGEAVTKEWITTNKYLTGEKDQPEGIQVIGGKTGTTSDAGSCLVLYSKKGEDPYISIVFKAEHADGLYEEMTQLLKEISNNS